MRDKTWTTLLVDEMDLHWDLGDVYRRYPMLARSRHLPQPLPDSKFCPTVAASTEMITFLFP